MGDECEDEGIILVFRAPSWAPESVVLMMIYPPVRLGGVLTEAVELVVAGSLVVCWENSCCLAFLHLYRLV